MKDPKCSICKINTINFNNQDIAMNNCAMHLQCQKCISMHFKFKENYNQCNKCFEFMFFNLGDQSKPTCSFCKNKPSKHKKNATLKRLCKNHLACCGCIRNKDYRTEINCNFCKDVLPMICMQCIKPNKLLHPNQSHLIHFYCRGCIPSMINDPSHIACSLCRIDYRLESAKKSENRCSYCSKQNKEMFGLCKNHIICTECYEYYKNHPDLFGESCQECMNNILEIICNTKSNTLPSARFANLNFKVEEDKHSNAENVHRTDRNIKVPNIETIRENSQGVYYDKGNNRIQHDSLTDRKIPDHSSKNPNKVDQTKIFTMKKHTYSDVNGIQTIEYTNEKPNPVGIHPIKNHSKSSADIKCYQDDNKYAASNISYNLMQSSASNPHQNYETSNSHFNQIYPSNPSDISNPKNENISSYATYEPQGRNLVYSDKPNIIPIQSNSLNPDLFNPYNQKLQGYNTYSSQNSYSNPSNAYIYPNSSSPSYSTGNALISPPKNICKIHMSDYYLFESCSHYQCHYCITTNFRKKFNKFLTYLSTRNIDKLNNPQKGLLGCPIKGCPNKYCIPYDYVKHEALEICNSKNYPQILSEHYQLHFEGIRATFFNCPSCTYPSGYYFEKKCLYCNYNQKK